MPKRSKNPPSLMETADRLKETLKTYCCHLMKGDSAITDDISAYEAARERWLTEFGPDGNWSIVKRETLEDDDGNDGVGEAKASERD